MTSVPLHPALVHIPLGLAFMLPLVTIVFAWTIWTGRLKTRSWLSVVLLLAVLLGTGLVAMNTGQREEDRAEAVVPEAAIATHEDLAEQFLWITGAGLAVAGLVLFLRRPVAIRIGTVATALCTFLIAGAALRVGHAGGQLVYVHNAASAYVSSKNPVPNGAEGAARTGGESSRNDGDDDDARLLQP